MEGGNEHIEKWCYHGIMELLSLYEHRRIGYQFSSDVGVAPGVDGYLNKYINTLYEPYGKEGDVEDNNNSNNQSGNIVSQGFCPGLG